jgi:hypothetical protein
VAVSAGLTLKEGSFAFYTLPDGNYEVNIAENTLPPEARLQSAPKAALAVCSRTVPTAVQFEIERRPVLERPARKVLEQ